MEETVAGCTIYSFQECSGYVVSHQGLNDEHLVAIGHTALVEPWRDPYVHQHEGSEEFYFLRRREMAFLVSGIPMTLKSYELLMIKPEIPHAIQGGEDMIEHFGIRALYLDDKQILDRALMKANLQFEDQRLFSGSWGHHIPLNLDQHKNCWLIGAGSARFHSQHMIMAYLDFPTFSSANAGIGTRHRLHLHRKSWEYYTVLEGTKTLQIENQLVTVEAGHILEVPPEVKHVLHSRTAPFKGFTIRVPVALNDKIEI